MWNSWYVSPETNVLSLAPFCLHKPQALLYKCTPGIKLVYKLRNTLFLLTYRSQDCYCMVGRIMCMLLLRLTSIFPGQSLRWAGQRQSCTPSARVVSAPSNVSLLVNYQEIVQISCASPGLSLYPCHAQVSWYTSFVLQNQIHPFKTK